MPIKLDKNKAKAELLTWSQMITMADDVFERDGQSPTGILIFLSAFQHFESIPENFTTIDMEKLSFIF